MLDRQELFLASLAKSWHLMTPGQLVAILADQADGGPNLTQALVDLGCATPARIEQMNRLRAQVFRNPLDDFSLDNLPQVGVIQRIDCARCDTTAEIEDYDPREEYRCEECGAVLPPAESSGGVPALATPLAMPLALSPEPDTGSDDLPDLVAEQMSAFDINAETAEVAAVDIPAADSGDLIGAPEPAVDDARAGGAAAGPTSGEPAATPADGPAAAARPRPPRRRRRRQNKAPVIVGLGTEPETATRPLPAPSTPAPSTPAPSTPASSAPASSAPAPSAPAPSAPASTAPSTTAPATPAPSTTGPASESPPTAEGPPDAALAPEPGTGPEPQPAAEPDRAPATEPEPPQPAEPEAVPKAVPDAVAGAASGTASAAEGVSPSPTAVAARACDCAIELAPEWAFCPLCGTATAPCDGCGRPQLAGWKRCPYCD